MPTKKRRLRTAAEHRPYRVQVYLTEQEGQQLAAHARQLDITQSLAVRELILQGLTQPEEANA